MTNDEIVDALKSDPQKAQEALDALFPKAEGVMLLVCRKHDDLTMTTGRVNASRMFLNILRVATHLGARLGFELNWLPKQEDPDQIVLAGSEMLR